MASHISFHRWLLRDIRPAYVLVVLVVFVVASLIYFIDWSTARSKNALQPEKENIEQRYIGSIKIPADNGMCWILKLDNRTETLRDARYAKCDEDVPKQADKFQPGGADMMRLHSVSKAFRN